MYEHFIWDFDGTLFDSYPLILTLHEKVLLELGIKEDMSKIYRMLLETSSSEVKKYYDKNYEITKDEFHKRYKEKEKNNADEYFNLAVPNEDVINVCKYIKDKNYDNYIISDRSKNTIIKLLENNNMIQYFKDIVSYDDGFQKKPDSGMFEFVLKKYELKKEQVLSIGDRNLDLVPSTNVGIDTCLYRPFSDKFDFTPKYIIKDMKELYKIIS